MIKTIRTDWHFPKKGELPVFELLEDVDINGYKIKKGFVTDGASVPFGARNSFNPMGRAFPAAIAHDHRCVTNQPRKEANELFHRDLIDCGVSKTKARMMFIGVETYRIFKRIK